MIIKLMTKHYYTPIIASSHGVELSQNKKKPILLHANKTLIHHSSTTNHRNLICSIKVDNPFVDGRIL